MFRFNNPQQKTSLKQCRKSHWFQICASKLLADQSGNIRVPNGFFGQNLRNKNIKQEK